MLLQEAALDQMRHEQALQESDALPSTGAPDGKRSAIYNAEALHDALEDLQQSGDLEEWENAQTITAGPVEAVEDADDDLTRELSFYNQVACTVHFPAPVYSPTGRKPAHENTTMGTGFGCCKAGNRQISGSRHDLDAAA